MASRVPKETEGSCCLVHLAYLGPQGPQDPRELWLTSKALFFQYLPGRTAKHQLVPLTLATQSLSLSTVLKERKGPGVFLAQKEKRGTKELKDHQALQWTPLT